MTRATRNERGIRLSQRARVWISGGLALALISTIAVIASGYDARETPRAEPGVWVARDAGQYARVNTDTGELDIVRKVLEPSGLIQSAGRSVMLSHGNGRAWPIDAANPVDFSDEPQSEAAVNESTSDEEPSTVEPVSAAEDAGSTAVRMPDGTREIVAAGRFVAVRTEAGQVFVGELMDGGNGTDVLTAQMRAEDLEGRLSSLRSVDPFAKEQKDQAAEDSASDDKKLGYLASAIAIADNGELIIYSTDENSIRRFDALTDEFVGRVATLPEATKSASILQLALTAGGWALLDAESGQLWREDAAETTLTLEGPAQLQGSVERGSGTPHTVVIADAAGLWSVPASGTPQRVAEAEGTPAQPVEVDGVLYAAWLGQSGGTLWQGERTLPLSFDDSVDNPGELTPVIRSNGQRAVLSETHTGMLWTLPDGVMIPLSQWNISDPPKEEQGTVVVAEVTEQIAPQTVDDAFGVRAGEPAPLSVLLNDFDANKRDVLTIVPESLGESPLPEAFGALQLLPGGQSLMVQPAEGSTGTATFQYRVTDGTLTSEPAAVTLTVVDDEINTAPEWCPVEGCQREWRVPAIVPGGTLVYPLLDDWVDAEGDVMMLASVSVVRPEDPVRAIVTSDGRLAVRHTDANAGATEVVLRVTVRDGRGEERQRDLPVAVQLDAPAEFAATAVTVKVGESITVNPLHRVAGGSGSFTLTDAAVQGGAERLRVTAQTGPGSIEILASEAGSSTVSLSVTDTMTGSEITGTLRVTATPSTPSLALPPLRAFVRPLSDSTVEVFDAIPGAQTRAVTVKSATVVDGELRADVIEHARVRVAGSTADGGAGRIGSVDVVIAEGSAVGQGRLTVFQVPETGSAGAIAVADSATVRAGSIVDIRVLDNDVSAPGERLLLHPQVSGSGTAGELAFASGSVLRYLAPTAPGTYRLSYTTYGASSPEVSDVGAVLVTVLPKGTNRDPQPRTLTARTAPGEQTEVRVPLSGVDPDGDRIRLTGIGSSKDPQLTLSISPVGAALTVAASAAAAPGLYEVEYFVRDDAGAQGIGTLRVIVAEGATGGGAPIATTDNVRLVAGGREPAVVRPLENDIDPALGKLAIVSVEPNVAGGADSPEYQRLAERLDLSQLTKGLVSVSSDDSLGTVSYRYVVRSSATKSTADGLIVVQTSARVGVQAPSVTDTVLNVRDRATLAGAGVDVLTDKVRWATGDASTLTLSLWGKSADKYRVDGNQIIGTYTPKGDLVVFRLSGKDSTGHDVETFGFLVIPTLDELKLTLKAGLKPLAVDEDKSVEARLGDLIDLGPGDRAELRQGEFSVGRGQASCTGTSAEQLRYVAGKEEPWSDTCLIEARLIGQDSWTSLPVPVIVVPKAPSVQLNPLARTIAPGAAETIELSDMVGWQGGRLGDPAKLRFEVSGGGTLFAVQANGARVTIEARADAVPGSQEVLSVAVSGAGESRAPLTLRIGEAPRDLPRGGTVALRCTVGGSCGTSVVGVAGEHDPFAGKAGGGLRLESVNGANCQVAAFSRVGDTAVAIAWPANRITGGTCTVSFTVHDAQGRAGEGSIEFDAQGLPEAPASISPSSVTGDSVTFIVELGEAQRAHPGVTGVTVSGAGSASCAPAGPASYQCVVSGLENGAPHDFSARAVNSVGSSSPSASVRAWAYQSPAKPEVTISTVPDPAVTPTHGMVEFSIRGASDVGGYRVTLGGETFELSGRDQTSVRHAAPVGAQQILVLPLSRFPPPAGAQPGGAVATAGVTVAGAPKLSAASLSSPDSQSIVAAASGADKNSSAQQLSYAFSIVRGLGAPDACPAQGTPASTQTFSGLKRFWAYTVRVCVYNGFGVAEATDRIRVGQDGSVPAPSGGLSYSIAPNADVVGSGARYQLSVSPTPVADASATLQYRIGADIRPDFALTSAAVQPVEVRQCFDPNDEGSCSNWVAVSWTGAPTTVEVDLTGVCVDPAALADSVQISAAAAGFAKLTATAGGVVTVSWLQDFSGLQPVSLSGTPCTPPPTP